MKSLVLVTIAGLAISNSAFGAPSSAKLLVPIHQFIASFNAGDTAKAAAAQARDVSIIDDIAPHFWRGPKAFETWAADLAADDKKSGISEEKVALGKTQRALIDGDTGYAVLKAVYTFKQNGADMIETATMTFALKSGKAGWKITAWSWDGSVPHPVAAK